MSTKHHKNIIYYLYLPPTPRVELKHSGQQKNQTKEKLALTCTQWADFLKADWPPDDVGASAKDSSAYTKISEHRTAAQRQKSNSLEKRNPVLACTKSQPWMLAS